MKKIISIFLTLILCIFYISCKNSLEKLNIISDTQIFEQAEDEYLVFFFKDNCSYCEDVAPTVVKYQDKKIPIYAVNLNNGEASAILRGDSGSDAQGPEKDYYVNGVTKYEDLYIPGTPSLIFVSKVGKEKQSRFVAEGKTSVLNVLGTLDDNTKYDVIYKDGNNEKLVSYYKWENATLANQKKENYILIGWKDIDTNEIYNINKVIDKNYKLEAVWFENEYKYISDTEIFEQQEDDYLVFFMKDGCPYCEKNKEDVLRYIYQRTQQEYQTSIPLYVVNLNYGDYKSPILRTYKDGQHDYNIDGLTSIDDMYIPATPTLIEITNKVASYIGAGTTIIRNALSYFLVKDGQSVDREKYVISFDTGTDEILSNIEYYKWDVVTDLPKPKKEGYIFSGWLLDNTVVTSVSGKSVTLTAKWLDQKYYREIEDYDIFNQKEKEYFVYFMKDGCTFCNKIKD